jgi:hypothetical protein
MRLLLLLTWVELEGASRSGVVVADGGEEVELGVVEEGACLLVGGVAGAQLPDLLLPPLHPLLVDRAEAVLEVGGEVLEQRTPRLQHLRHLLRCIPVQHNRSMNDKWRN